MGETSAGVVWGRRNRVILATTLVLCATASALTWLGSADPPLDLRNSAYWVQTLSRVPGLLDVCGDFTWPARAVPAVLAALGAGVAILVAPRSRLSLSFAVGALAVSALLIFATTQNATPMGELGCIID